MLVSDLKAPAALIAKVSNTESIAPLYRCVEINNGNLRAASEYGVIEHILNIQEGTGIASLLVDSAAFCAVINSLPEKAEVKFIEQGGKIAWSCGSARGSWVTVNVEGKIPAINLDQDFNWTAPPKFVAALRLAAIACDSTTVSVGLFGIEIEPVITNPTTQSTRLASSNAVTLSCVDLPVAFPYPKITLRPPVDKILAALLQDHPDVAIAINTQSITIGHFDFIAQLPLSIPLEFKLDQMRARFASRDYEISVDTNAIKAFLTRAHALADRGSDATMNLTIADGGLMLTHSSMASSTEEYFLAQGLDKSWQFSSVSIVIKAVMDAIPNVDTVVLDHLKSKVLVLRGVDPDFMYVIGGNQ